MFNILFHLKNIGLGAMVSAAFIGPGTITTCIKAGIDNGYTLLWALLFSTISCIIIQEMSSRLGVVTQMGLSENIKRRIKHPILKFISISMVVGAILFGKCRKCMIQHSIDRKLDDVATYGGTAQVADELGRWNTGLYTTTLAGFFPIDNPKYSILVSFRTKSTIWSLGREVFPEIVNELSKEL